MYLSCLYSHPPFTPPKIVAGPAVPPQPALSPIEIGHWGGVLFMILLSCPPKITGDDVFLALWLEPLEMSCPERQSNLKCPLLCQLRQTGPVLQSGCPPKVCVGSCEALFVEMTSWLSTLLLRHGRPSPLKPGYRPLSLGVENSSCSRSSCGLPRVPWLHHSNYSS